MKKFAYVTEKGIMHVVKERKTAEQYSANGKVVETEIKEFLADESNFTKNRIRAIKYIVVHYTGNNGDTAKGNCNFSSAPNRNKSAHYFVDENSVYRSVRDLSVAWHCGATKYVHPLCRNSNSIGVEMCSRIDKNGKYYIKKETVKNTIWLVKTLMKKYDVPVEKSQQK